MNLNEQIIKMLNEFHTINSIDGIGEHYEKFLNHPSVGIVVNTDDPLQQGRVQVFCPAYGDNPKKMLHLPWSAYLSPFGGSIKNDKFTRGAKVGPEKSTGAVHYGMWAVPEQGAHVVVGCLDGDPRRRFYFGCLPEHQETHTLLHGRFKWGEGGIPDGPLTSDNEPIEPIYTNYGKAFQEDRTSREWKTRGAEYQVTAVREDVGENPNDTKTTYLDQQYDKISEAEQDSWVKPILGAHGYDWTGLKNLGEFLSSRVYGFSSPGFHSWSMDDRAFNCRFRLRSATGHQIILDDTNERIYIMTNQGKSWVEMDSSGNIDIHSDKRISMHAKQDINFSTEETFRVHAKKGIHLYSGNKTDQENLPNAPSPGEIRIQAEDDFHLITRKNMRWLSFEDSLFEIGGKKCETIGESSFLQVQDSINVVTNTGNYNLTITGDINELVNGDVSKLALGSMVNASNGKAKYNSYYSDMEIGSQKFLSVKSISSDIGLECMGLNPADSGAIVLKTPESQQGVTNKGIFLSTNLDIVMKAQGQIHQELSATPVAMFNQELLSAPNFGACSSSLIDAFLSISALADSGTFYTLSGGGVNIQSAIDINFKSIQFSNSTKMFDGACALVPKLNETISNLNGLTLATGSFMTAVASAAFNAGGWAATVAAAIAFVGAIADFISQIPSFPSIGFLLDLGCDIPLNNLNAPNFDLPNFEAAYHMTFTVPGHNGCGI